MERLVVTRLVEIQAARQPNWIAVESGGLRWTYDELNRRADELASSLRALGAGPGVAVGICMNRSAGMIAGLLGILK
ncbi:AMP-binding protein, partial [Klebsiella pneumoniae]|uniref:AMP-binding protein n=1 Tax=Klebsiella pneumoniae TaxID=573 RepID=UPI00301396F2